ncbi:PH domain-containing protein [Camelliibacillus cellulosilyticus]|uniref:PH domain-containing protein n=1 Tax=Camelliibacillus cellulosilyticus TaxID=2174486 RepID=A0ABV9GSW5_9BACL
MTFPSEKGIGLGLIIWLFGLLPLIGIGIFTIYDIITDTASVGEEVVLLGVAVLSFGFSVFIIWSWFDTSYTITEENLLIKHGPFRKIIPLRDITYAGKSNSVYSGPALSMKRIDITYNKMGYTVISPVDRDRFLKSLKEKCPQARIDPGVRR